MSATSNWQTIRKQVIGQDEGRAERARAAMEAELALGPLRKRRKASQAEIAKRLAVSQSSVSQVERGLDLKLSTIRGYVEALGGRLVINAVFDDETIPIQTAKRSAGRKGAASAKKPRRVKATRS